MRLSLFVSGVVVLAGLSAARAVPAVAQTTHPAGRTATGLATIAPPTPDADELAEQMRALAKNPKDVKALIRAGELTLLLGDPTAAAVLFSRAEKIEPGNARMKAGMAATLVRMERPGEALRLFAEAERDGYDVEKFAAERGLAYDLIGAQAYAQRDYKLALDHDRTDETVRRYALSLGISGQKDAAMAALDPLLRKQDRAAWRDRAFILAMNDEADEAEKIANAMMPGPVSEGLKPFFARLAGLSAVDRAFAIHFGELQPTPARLADAKLVPALPPLPGESRPTRLASAAPVMTRPTPQPARRERSAADERGPKPKPLAPGRTALPTTSVPATDDRAQRVATTPAPIRMAGNGARPAEAPMATKPLANTPSTAPETAPRPATPAGPVLTPSTGSTSAAPSAVGSEDSILARIIANVTVPESELGVAVQPDRTAASASTPAAAMTAVGTEANAVTQAQAALDAAAAKAEADRLAAVKEAAKRKAERDAKAEADRKAAAKKAAEEKAAADKKAKAEKAAAAKKAAEAKKAKAEPSRVWVQVAGGANESNLARAFARVVDKAPALMKGKQGWWTPLNATNRVLAGPFKSTAEAQAFVNKLAGAGVSAFPFTSKDGQKVTRLSGK
ncbi:MAG TPA: SPOR domain-containing protein [Sphingomonas sp.]|nr:SPOR domain-containing protein [Sphingomonas sp.]